MTTAGADDAAIALVEPAPWAPLSGRAFRWLWVGIMVSYVGLFMQTVGAQWLVVDAPNAAALVAFVQAASTLPGMLLALPAGVLADAFDRRWLLLSLQVYVLVVASLLAVLTATDQMPPTLLLVFTFALGVGAAVQIPTWQAMIPDLVPRPTLRAAARLDAIGVNVARAIGPAFAGVLIAVAGVPWVFALNAVLVLPLMAALVLWRRPREAPDARERFLPALRSGGRYVRHEPAVRHLLVRAAVFILPAMAVWSLLPVIVSDQLGLGPSGYGVMFAALGAGAIVAALFVRHLANRLRTNTVLGLASLVYATTTLLVSQASQSWVALLLLLVTGMAWMTCVSTLGAELQLFLPVWVRARGLATLMVVFFGSQAAGAIAWGLVADTFGVETALLTAAGLMLAGFALGLARPVDETAHLDRSPAVYWPEARLEVDPEPRSGPIVVAVHYTVAPDVVDAFLTTMDELRLSRRRTGATRWEVYQDGERPDHFVELFSVPSWQEHLAQHEGRLTAADQQAEAAAAVLSEPPPWAEHLLPPAR